MLFLFEFDVEVFDVDEEDEFEDDGRTEFRTLRLNTAFFRPPVFFTLLGYAKNGYISFASIKILHMIKITLADMSSTFFKV